MSHDHYSADQEARDDERRHEARGAEARASQARTPKPVTPGTHGGALLEALCQYVYQHGNVAADAQFAAAVLLNTIGVEPRDPGYGARELALSELVSARLNLAAVTGGE